MNWKSIDDVVADFDHKGQKVVDALLHVANVHLRGLGIREMGHLITVVHEEWQTLARHMNAEQYEKALAHTKTKFLARARGAQWPYTVSALVIAHLLDAHNGVKSR